MANKKGKKANKGGKTAGHGEKGTKNKGELGRELSPQDRVEAVRPFWESQPHAERVKLLTVDLQTLHERAKLLTEATRQQAAVEIDGEQLDMLAMGLEPTMEEVLDEGVTRLKTRTTWKLWNWPLDQKEFTDAESFRQHITDKHIKEEVRKYLPRDDPKAPERPAEEAFRKRMTDLLNRVQQQNQRHFEEMNKLGSGNSKDKDRATKERDKERERQKEQQDKEQEKEVSPAASADKDDRVNIYRRRRHHAADANSLSRDTNIELINIMLEALEQENEVLYHTLLLPVTSFIMEALPEESRDTVKLDLNYEDFEKLMPEDAIQVVEWLTEKVDALTTKLKAEIKEDEEPEDEEMMGDVDLWALTDDGASLTVNSKWLQHLQDRLLGEDGHPRKVKPGEDPHSNGLVLEWVYGSIVSTAEKARDGAKRALGSHLPLPSEAHHALLRALEEQHIWDTRLVQARQLLQEMLKSRLEAAELAKNWDIRPVPKSAKPEEVPADDSLPDHVIVAMLRREALLTKAKLHYSLFEHIVQERQLRTWKAQLKQGEPEFERLKRELEEVKHSHRGLDSTYRSQAEMERHRAQLADAAIEEQLEVQTAFREQGALLQGIYDKKQRAEYEMARRETEIKQLQGWKGTVENLIDKFTDLMTAQARAAAEADEEEGGEAGVRCEKSSDDMTWEHGGHLSADKYLQLVKLRSHVHKDVRKQLYSDADDKIFFDNLKNEIKAIEKRMEEVRVVIQHLEMQLLNVACDDPGIVIGLQLVLPILQERLDQCGKQWAADRAKMAASEIIRMEQEQAEREAAERERKRASKAAKKDKLKSEKEKERADREAREQAELQRKQQEEADRKKRDEEERRKRAEQLEALRKAEEEYMEQRRKELLSDENGYWRMRMRMEEQRAAVDAAIMALTDVVDDIPANAEQPAAQTPAPVPMRRNVTDTTDTHRKRSQTTQAPVAQGKRETAAADAADGKAPALERDSRSSDQGAIKDQQLAAPAPQPAPSTQSPGKPAAAPVTAAPKPAEGVPATKPTAVPSPTKPVVVPVVPVKPVVLQESQQTAKPGQAPASLPTVTPAPLPAPVPVAVPVAQPAPHAQVVPPTTLPAAPPAQPPAPAPVSPTAAVAQPPRATAVPVAVPTQVIHFGAVPVPVTTPVLVAQSAARSGAAGADSKSSAGDSAGVDAGSKATEQRPAAPASSGEVGPASGQQTPAALAQVPPAVPSAPAMPQVPARPGVPHAMVMPAGAIPPPPPQTVRSVQANSQQASAAPVPGMAAAVPRQSGQVLPGNMPQAMGPQGPRMVPGQMPVLPPFANGVPQPNGMVVPGPGGPGHFLPVMPHQQPGHPGMMHPGAGHMAPAHIMPMHLPPQPHGPQPPMQPQVASPLPPSPPPPAPQQAPPAVPQAAGSDAEQQAKQDSSTGSASNDKTLNVAAKPFVPSFGSKAAPVVTVPPPQPPPQPSPPQQQQQVPKPPAPQQPPQPMGSPQMMNGHPNPGMVFPMHMAQPQPGMMGLMPGGQQFPMPFPGMQPGMQPGVRMPMAPQQVPGANRNDRRQGPRQQQPPMPGMPQQAQPPIPGPGQQFMVMPNGMPVDPRTQLMFQHMPPLPHHLPPQMHLPMGMHPGMHPMMMMQQQQQQPGPLPHGHVPPQMQGPPQGPVPPSQAVKSHQSEQQAPLSPDGPLDQSQNTSDNSSTSEDSHAAQQSTAEQETAQQPQQPAAPAAETTAQTQQAGAQGSAEVTASDPAGSLQTASSAQSIPSKSSWSAVAARERAGSSEATSSPVRPVAAAAAAAASQAAAAQQQAAQLQAQAAAAAAGGNVSWKNMLQQSMPPGSQPRWAGTPPVGNFSAPNNKQQHTQHKLHVTETGVVVYEQPGQAPRNLQLVRGLRNGEGEYNCFLNVIIQSLWHLRGFRQAMLTMQPVRDGGADAQVQAALCAIFKAMAAKPAIAAAAAAAGGAAVQGACTVSPAELRTALAALDHGQAAVRVEQSDMHDAAEVLGQILECLHRAEVTANQAPGSSAVHDITLPLKVKQAAAGRSPVPVSTVHRLFGIDVQVACPPTSEDEVRKGGRNQRGQNQPSSGPQASGGSGGNSSGTPNSGGDVQQFTKFFHLVPAKGLRQAYSDALTPSGSVSCSWEELLVAVEAAGSGQGQGAGTLQPSVTLLRRPKVFSLAVVWESPQVPTEAIRGTLSAFGPALEVPALFRIPPAAAASWPPGLGSTYTLRAVVCYFGHHYVAFVLSEELKVWLSFDDAEIAVIGEWPDVCRSMLARRMQPSLLIYEDVPPTQN